MKERTKKLERLERHIADRHSVMATIIEAIQTNEKRAGQEGYRHDYDKALHIRVALKLAGFKIVRDPQSRKEHTHE